MECCGEEDKIGAPLGAGLMRDAGRRNEVVDEEDRGIVCDSNELKFKPLLPELTGENRESTGKEPCVPSRRFASEKPIGFCPPISTDGVSIECVGFSITRGL